nr:hypothetical protein [Tanacetum cinerariifolium]
MLNKENYVPWLFRLLQYAKSRPNGKLIHNSILNGPYVRRMIPEPGDAERDVNVNETFHERTDDKLYERELKQIEVDDQTIQTILLGLPEDIYAAVDTDYTQLYDFLKYNQKEVDELKAERLTKIQDPLALMANSNNPYASPAIHQDLSPFNQNYMQQPMPNPEDITDPTTAMNMALALIAKAFKLNYSTPTNNNQRISSNPRNRQIAQPGMNMGQDRQMQMVGGNGGNQFRQYAGQNAGNLNGYNAVQNVRNQNQIGNGNLVAVRAEGNAAGHNKNQISIQAKLLNNNQRISSNPRNRQIAQPGQNAGNPAGYNDVIGNQVIQNAVQNPRVQNVGNQNQIRNGNLVAARTEGNATGQNGNQIRQMQMIGECQESGCSESKSLECWKSEWANWCSRKWKSELDWEW